jgi:hypothetical protein
MVCTRLSEFLNYELPHYDDEIRKTKRELDEITGFSNWIYLAERHFQKTRFNEWAASERKEFCRDCNANGNCGIKG